jgi:hypothetical protein
MQQSPGVEGNLKEVLSDTVQNGMPKSNLDLVHDIQDRWIRFVFDDDADLRIGQIERGADQISVYGKDRVMRMESLVDGVEWQLQRKRFETLEKHIESATAFRRSLTGNPLTN